MDTRSINAAIRFGLGPRPDQPVTGDPVAWLKTQLRQPDGPLPVPEGWDHLPTTVDCVQAWWQDGANPLPMKPPTRGDTLFTVERVAAAAQWITSATPFRERMVMFWTNHLTVSRRGGSVLYFIGDYTRTAIRPHIAGDFGDMLVAAIRHPGMLIYLNQNSSVGPNSRTGLRRNRGLNENLARELLELHTLSPASGYTQQDVTEMARLLTGLGVSREKEPFNTIFRPENHEPGDKTILGKTFPAGEEQVDAALRWLANHEATHRHLAVKLARHFIADDPPAAVVQRIFGVLRDSKGNLGATMDAVVDSPEAWDKPLSKLRSPQDFIIAAYRGVGAPADVARTAVNYCGQLAQPVWMAEQPIGWPDRGEDWVSPEGVLQRMERAYDIAGRYTRLDPIAVAQTTLGPLARPETLQAVRRAGSMRDALTLLLASPEFQRR
jgi:uncharacterized protein (DUF1800 family)